MESKSNTPISSFLANLQLQEGIARNKRISDAVHARFNVQLFRSDFTDFTEEADMIKPRYKELQHQFNDMRDFVGIRYFYIAGRNKDGQLIYLVDGLDLVAEDFAVPGCLIEDEMIPYIERALAGETVYSNDIVDTTWGPIFTACYPITATDGSGG